MEILPPICEMHTLRVTFSVGIHEFSRVKSYPFRGPKSQDLAKLILVAFCSFVYILPNIVGTLKLLFPSTQPSQNKNKKFHKVCSIWAAVLPNRVLLSYAGVSGCQSWLGLLTLQMQSLQATGDG